jgi:hypothetical protein
MSEELKPYKDIDIKFTRLSKPILNTIDLPLSGLYNDINNKEFSNFPLKNKFKNFGISSPDHIGLENIFQLNNSFGRLLTEEILEGLIILTNISNKEITILNLEITFNVEEIKTEKEKNKEKNKEKQKKTLPINLPGPDNSLLFLPNQSFSIKIQNYLKYSGKYTINVNFRTKCPIYTQQFYTLKQRLKLKEKYIVNKDNQIEFMLNKIFSFLVSYPFNIKSSFRMNQMKEEYFIDINIKNESRYTLTLPDLIIIPKNRNKIHFKPVLNLQQIQNTENNPENGGYQNNSKIFCLQPDEEVNLFFKNNSSEIFLNEESFILYIKWLNVFDFSPKTFEYEFKNELPIYNEYFIFQIIERPMGNIIQNNNFPIVFQFITKHPEKSFSIVISEYQNNDNQNNDHLDENKNKIIKNNGNEINIKIKEYKIEINNNSQKNNVNIICKSNKLGIVTFPKIYITLYEIENNDEKKIAEYIYKDFLSFKCVQNVQLI